VGRSGQSLEDIVAAVTKVGVIIGDIAQAGQEQSQGIDQVNRAVSQMDHVVQQNASQTSELASTAQVLAHQAAELEALVGRFRLDGAGPVPATPAVGPRRPEWAGTPPRSTGPSGFELEHADETVEAARR
jgi:ABC-type transporter Mla subunit MlaD